MLKTEKLLRVKNYRGQTVRVVREHYLREDVPCNSELCLAECAQTKGVGRLPAGLTHYVVPDCQAARDFLEILELPEICGILFLQTVLHSVLHQGSRRAYTRIRNVVKDPRQQCSIFANEFCHYAYNERKAGESLNDWQSRTVYDGAVWYYNHLAGQIPILVITEDTKLIKELGAKTTGVFLLSMEEYLKKFWSSVTNALDIYESLSASLKETADMKGNVKAKKDYLPQEVVAAGIKSGRYVQGCLQVNKHRPQQEAFLQRTGTGMKNTDAESDILIPGANNRNRAVHGDIVAVELLPRMEWQGRSKSLAQSEDMQDKGTDSESNTTMPTGRVVGIVQRNWRDYVASFPQNTEGQGQRSKGGRILVIPYDYRIPRIRISTRQAETLQHHRVIVRIDSWPLDSQYPNGHFVRTLGTIGSLETEIASILVENNISVRAFSEGQIKELPTNSEEKPWTMDPEEVARRRDLHQSHLIFSIDPKGCEDVDDTLSVRQLPNGNLELGVHIADVSYFVKPNSLTDLEAKARATTVYLADRRHDMLPAILSADLCSLIGGVDRYAMTVLWELDSNYEVQNVWYGRTIIRSAYKMFYEAAQALHDGNVPLEDIPELENLDAETLEHRLNELKWCISKLMHIARHLRSKRESGGAVQLEGVEVQVQLGEKKEIEDLIPKQPLEIHETIAECMIFANHWVAKKIAETFPHSSLLRHHPLPRQEHFGNLNHCAKSKGMTVDTSSNKSLAESLDQCVDPKDPVFNKILRTLATYAMSNALYFSTGSLSRDQYYHYGLALDKYTHFTSPIRRYADVIVHRLLMAAINGEEEALPGNKELQDLCDHINTKNRASQHAQKASQELFQSLFFKDKDPEKDECCTVDAVIFELRANGMLVFIPRYGMKGAVYLKDKSGLVVDVSEGKLHWLPGTLSKGDFSLTVTTSNGSTSYHLFDHITVRISVTPSHAHPLMLHLEMVDNKPHQIETSQEGNNQDQISNVPNKTDIVKEVTKEVKLAESVSHTDANDLGPNYSDLKSKYGQTSEAISIYSLLQQFKEMALREDLDESQS
ncbi:DIS3-like exonuclease 1 isoform X2 [Ptychodera flava]|uniref:DIS3-like exonuclease 1 isoform X2 n=1 Tax=Ptychodera flava TaxID=63121 RepID=UPI00396A818C